MGSKISKYKIKMSSPNQNIYNNVDNKSKVKIIPKFSESNYPLGIDNYDEWY